MENSENRLQEVFFYGLYMDPEILKSKGVNPRNPRLGIAKGYKLRVGQMATLLRDEESEAYGIIYSLTHAEINSLYWGAGLDTYISEALHIETENGKSIAALCCNLLIPPKENESNPEYYAKLVECMKKYNVPTPKI